VGRRSRIASTILTAGLVLAACGSDDQSATETTSDSASGATTAVVGDADCPPTEGADTQTRQFDGPPPDCLVDGVTYEAVVTTNKGEFTIELDPAPTTSVDLADCDLVIESVVEDLDRQDHPVRRARRHREGRHPRHQHLDAAGHRDGHGHRRPTRCAASTSSTRPR
jgi:hypothetical protein